MPLIQIHLAKGKSAKYVKSIMDGVHEALCTAWKIPANDRFQMVTEHKKEHFHFDKTIWGVKRFDKTIWGVKRSGNLIAIYITSIKRTKAMKVKLYKELIKVLQKKAKVRNEDVFVTLVQVKREDWSFGNGLAQLLN